MVRQGIEQEIENHRKRFENKLKWFGGSIGGMALNGYLASVDNGGDRALFVAGAALGAIGGSMHLLEAHKSAVTIAALEGALAQHDLQFENVFVETPPIDTQTIE